MCLYFLSFRRGCLQEQHRHLMYPEVVSSARVIATMPRTSESKVLCARTVCVCNAFNGALWASRHPKSPGTVKTKTRKPPIVAYLTHTKDNPSREALNPKCVRVADTLIVHSRYMRAPAFRISVPPSQNIRADCGERRRPVESRAMPSARASRGLEFKQGNKGRGTCMPPLQCRIAGESE